MIGPSIGNLGSGEKQDRNTEQSLNIGRKIGSKSESIGGKMELNGSTSETFDGKLEKNGSKSGISGGKVEKIENIRGKMEKNGPLRWASMALCWGGRCLLNKKKNNLFLFSEKNSRQLL